MNVRENAHMFWWLYHVESNATDAPLILWLQVCSARLLKRCIYSHVSCFQGGPGSSSTGFGNFQEIGPLDVNLKPRNHSWVRRKLVEFRFFWKADYYLRFQWQMCCLLITPLERGTVTSRTNLLTQPTFQWLLQIWSLCSRNSCTRFLLIRSAESISHFQINLYLSL